MADVRGTYALVLAMDDETTVEVGKLGICRFPGGFYLYVGSGMGGLFARVRRHIEKSGKLRWHIDYLRRNTKPVEVWYVISDQRLECGWVNTAAGMPGARTPVRGFGSSDCGCPSHLLHFAAMPSYVAFRKRLGAAGLGLTRMPLQSPRSD